MSSSVSELVARLARALDGTPATPVRVSGLRGSAPALCVARLVAERPRPVVVTLASATEAEAFAADVRFYLGDPAGAGPLARRVHYLPGWEVPPFEALSPTRETVAARSEGLYQLAHTAAPVVVTTAEAWLQRCLPRAVFAEAVTYVVEGETLAPDALAARLSEWGYHRVPLVQDPGDTAVRGGIVDVFPAGYERPVRLEFADDAIASLREFDPASQRSLDRLEEVLLLPVREFGLSRLGPETARQIDERAAELGLARQERRDLVEAVRSGLVLPGFEQLLPYLYDAPATLADYLPPGAFLWWQEAGAVDAAVESTWAQVESHADAAAREGRFHPPPTNLYVPPAAWRQAIGARRRVEAETLQVLEAGAITATTHATEGLALRTAPGPDGPLATVATRVREWQEAGTQVVLVGATESQRDRMVALLSGHGIGVTPTRAAFPQAVAGAGRGALALVGELTRGAWLPADRLSLVTDSGSAGTCGAARGDARPTSSRRSPSSSRTTTSSTSTTASRPTAASGTCSSPTPRATTSTSSTPAATGSTCPSTASTSSSAT